MWLIAAVDAIDHAREVAHHRLALWRPSAIALCLSCVVGVGCADGGPADAEVLGESATRDATTTSGSSSSPTSTVAPPSTPAAGGAVEGTIEVPDGYERLRVTLRSDDGAEVGVVEASVPEAFVFHVTTPGRYELLAELTSGIASDEEGDISASTLTRTAMFDVGAGEIVRYTCTSTCEPS